MFKAINDFVRKCDTCERETKSMWKAPLQSILASEPMEHWQIDFTGPYCYEVEEGGDIKQKKKMCLLGVDCFSKMLFGTIFSTKKCSQVAEWVREKIAEEGIMKMVQVDNGSEFISAEVKEVYKQYKIASMLGIGI